MGNGVTESELAALRSFHGHLGPYVLAGLRLGRYAIRRLGAEPHFGCEADVYCPGRPPGSCFLDGIQWATGCTLGKKNIRHHAGQVVELRMLNRRTGERVRVRLNPQAISKAVEAMREQNDEAGARVLIAMADEELLEEIAET